MEQGYRSDWAAIVEVSSHFRGFVGGLAGSYVVECSCDCPSVVERRGEETTGPETRGSDSAVFQKPMPIGPARSGEE